MISRIRERLVELGRLMRSYPGKTGVLFIYLVVALLLWIQPAWWEPCIWGVLLIANMVYDTRQERYQDRLRSVCLINGVTDLSYGPSPSAKAWLDACSTTETALLQALTALETEQAALAKCRAQYQGRYLHHLELRQAKLATLRQYILAAGPHTSLFY